MKTKAQRCRAKAERLLKDLLALCGASTVSIVKGVQPPGATRRTRPQLYATLPPLIRSAADLCAASGVEEIELEGPRQLADMLEGKT